MSAKRNWVRSALLAFGLAAATAASGCADGTTTFGPPTPGGSNSQR